MKIEARRRYEAICRGVLLGVAALAPNPLLAAESIPLLLAETNRIASSAQVPTSSTLFMVKVYNEFFISNRFGYGSAMLWIFFLVILILTLLLQRLSRRFVFYQVGCD